MTAADTTASEKPKKRTSLRRAIVRRLVVAAVLLTLYVLSIGPLYWEWYDSRFNDGGLFWGAFYEPLFQAGLLCPPLARLIDSYIMLWV